MSDPISLPQLVTRSLAFEGSRSPDIGLVSQIDPVQMVVLQSTTACNMNCDYCYLSEQSRRSNQSMSLATLRTVFANILASDHVGNSLVVCWHAGEPLVLPPSYYEDAIQIIMDAASARPSGFELRFDMQTNATLINREWCDFFKRHAHQFELGVSCDGPRQLHDTHRKSWAGKPTFDRVERGIAQLCDAGMRFNLIAVVPPNSLHYADDLFDFAFGLRHNLTDFHFNFLDSYATASSDRLGSCHPDRSLYERFLQRLLDRLTAVPGDDGSGFRIRNFSHVYKKLFASAEVREVYSARNMSRPLRTLNVEVDGTATTFYAGITSTNHRDLYDDGRGLAIGNLAENSLNDIAKSLKLKRIQADFERSQLACDRGCEYAEICSGGFTLTKHDRFGTFDATETPECSIQVKTLIDTIVADLRRHIDPSNAPSQASDRLEGA